MEKLFDITNHQSLKNAINEIKSEFKPGNVYGLIGDLGAGKTTFVSGLCREMGVKEEVVSPTYILRNEYSSDLIKIEHWDLYRCKTIPEELLSVLPRDCIRIIEWADLLPTEYRPEIELIFSLDSSARRTLLFRSV